MKQYILSSSLITVSSSSEGASDWSDLSELSNGRTVHVWHDGGGKDGSAAGIFARILDSNFQRVGEEFQVNTDTYNFQTKARVVAIEDGNFLITWSGGDGTLQGQIYNQQGVKVNGQFEIAPWFVGEADLFVVGGKFWVLRSQANENAGILAIYEADGTEVANDIKISTNLGSELRIAELGNDRYVVVSYDNKNTTTTGDDPDIYAQLVDASGNLIGNQITLNAHIEDDQKAPEVVSTGDGGFAVVWQEESSTTSWDIYFRMYDGAGQAVSDPLLLNATTLGAQIKPYIEHSPTGGYLVTWESNHLGASEVFYQELTATGAKIGGNVLLSVDANGAAVHGTDATMQKLSNGDVVAEWDSQGNVFAKVFSTSDVPVSLTTSVMETSFVPNVILRSSSSAPIKDATVSIQDAFGVINTSSAEALSITSTKVTSAELIADTSGAVSISDVILQLRHIVGLEELEGLNRVAADNDGDGSVKISDVITSLRLIVGLEDAPNALILNGAGERQFEFDATAGDLYVVAPGDSDLSWTYADIV